MTNESRHAALLSLWEARLAKNIARLSPWRRREGVSCYRAYDRDTPELPLAVDVFVDDDTGLPLVLLNAWAPKHGGGQAFADLAESCARSAARMLGADDRVVVQLREPGPGGELLHDELESSRFEFWAREGTARFRIRLGARRDPGLFLDHRITRGRVAAVAAGRRVLNLFAYTGSFSVHAALAGASEWLLVFV